MVSTGSKTSTFEKLGKELMEIMPDGTRAFLMLRYSENLPLKELWRSGPASRGIGGDGKRVLGLCFKRERAVLIHDAEKDTQMRGIRARSLSSALCVPIFDDEKSMLGALLLTSDQAGAFAQEHRIAAERSARDFGPVVASLGQLPQVKHEIDPRSFEFLFSRVALGILMVLGVGLAVWATAPSPKRPNPPPSVVLPEVASEPRERSNDFLEALRSADYESAWEFLDPDLRGRWSSADFTRAMSDWAQRGDNSEILKNRKISKEQRHNRTALVLFWESSVQGDRGHWSWELREKGREWSIVRMEGPVNSPAESAR